VSNLNEFEIKMKKSSKFTFDGEIIGFDDETNPFIQPGHSKKMTWKGYFNSCTTTGTEIEAFVRVKSRKTKGKGKRHGGCKCINFFLSRLLFICDMNISLGHFVSSLVASL